MLAYSPLGDKDLPPLNHYQGLKRPSSLCL
jgi:hypothetical protein